MWIFIGNRSVLQKAILLVTALALAFVSTAAAQIPGRASSCTCYCGKVVAPPCSDQACKNACGWRDPSQNPPPNSQPTPSGPTKEELDRQAREREDERKRKEADRKRQEDAVKAAEEAAKQADFIKKRDEAAMDLKGLNSSSTPKLIELSNTDIGNPSNDPMVVDARDAPTGLPKSVAEAIPLTQAGRRIRKGFEAIQANDWAVAKAWFQDALKYSPKDQNLKRLIDLVVFTIDFKSRISQAESSQSQILTKKGSESGEASMVKGGGLDWMTRTIVTQMAARARADFVFREFQKKYGERRAIERSAAVVRANAGIGYSDEELNAQFQRAFNIYQETKAKKPRADNVGNPEYGKILPTPAKTYPATPWGKFLKFYDDLVNPPEAYIGPEAQEVVLGGKG
ncbi:MAG: hypothetical protein ABL952_02065 [Pyrinomonadaceae bacterium]